MFVYRHIQICSGSCFDFLFLVGKQDAQLADARLERDSRRRQKEQMTDETNKLVAHVELLKRLVISLLPLFFIAEINAHLWRLQIVTHESLMCFWSQTADLTARLQREKDELTAAHETAMRHVEKLTTENGDLGVSNTTLKVQVAEQLARGNRQCKR